MAVSGSKEIAAPAAVALAKDPFARNPNVKKLSGRDAWRLRTGPARSSRSSSSGRAGAHMIKPQIIEKDGSPSTRSSLWPSGAGSRR